MKNTHKLMLAILGSVIFAVVLTCASAGGGGGDPLPVPATGEWMTYDDQGSDGGSSVCNLEVTEEEIGGRMVKVYNVSGNVTTQFEYGFAGWGLDADEATLESYKNARAISFMIIGDGNKYSCKFKISTVEDYCYHEFAFDTIPGVPLYVEIPMKFFMQPPWGTTLKFDPTLATGIEWQTHETWRTDPKNNPFSVKMWDFMVHPLPASEKPKAAAVEKTLSASGIPIPMEVTLKDNFQYSDTWAGDIRVKELMNGEQFVKGDSYTVKVTYTVSRDFSNVLQICLVDQSPAVNYWKALSWAQKGNEPSPHDVSGGVPPKAGQTYTAELVLPVVIGATSKAPAANTLRFESVGKRSEGTAVVTFTDVVFTKN